MGLSLKFFNPANYKAMIDIAKISDGLSKHMSKRCAYCDLDLGTGEDFPVVQFVDHLVGEHPDKISPDDVEHYRKLIEKVTK